MKHSILLICLTLLLSVSCKKEETPTPAAKTKTDILTAHHWKLVSLTVDPPIVVQGTPITNWYAQLDACDVDNLTKYNTNGTVTYDEGATKCDPTDPQTSSTQWSFNSTETIITEDGDDENLINLTDSELKVSFIMTINSINHTATGTFNKP